MLWIILASLLFSFSGWVALIKYMTEPCDGLPGEDVTYCGAFWLGLASLLPVAAIAFNLFWIFSLVLKFPKCPVAFKGKHPK